jgi:hypothetical protein
VFARGARKDTAEMSTKEVERRRFDGSAVKITSPQPKKKKVQKKIE